MKYIGTQPRLVTSEMKFTVFSSYMYQSNQSHKQTENLTMNLAGNTKYDCRFELDVYSTKCSSK